MGGMADRRKQQNYENLPYYLLEDVWNNFERQSQEKNTSILVQHAWQLGLRCPSESNLLNIVNPQPGQNLSAFQRYERLGNLKKEWRKWKAAKKLEDYQYNQYVQVLPQDPRQLPAEYYLVAFQDGAPVPPRDWICYICLALYSLAFGKI